MAGFQEEIEHGLQAAEYEGLNEDERERRKQEAADVSRWWNRWDAARKHDEKARKQYAIDRRYARGDTGFEVDVPLIPTFIDILLAFLYARNPDLDITPSPAVVPPNFEALMDAAQMNADKDPETQQLVQERAQEIAVEMAEAAAVEAAKMQAETNMPVPQPGPEDIMPKALEAARREIVREQAEAFRRRWMQRHREHKSLAATLEIVVQHHWDKASLKRVAKRWVRSGLSVGIGWMKATWQTETEVDPITAARVASTMQRLRRVAAKRAEIEEDGQTDDAMLAEFERDLKQIARDTEHMVDQGLVVEFVSAEDVQTSLDIDSIEEYLHASWIGQRFFMTLERAKEDFPDVPEEKWAKATRFQPRAIELSVNSNGSREADKITADEADGYVEAGASTQNDAGIAASDDDSAAWIMGVEFWNRSQKCIQTTIKGIDCWAAHDKDPPPTTRFYPFFKYDMAPVDGQRHPQSLVFRTHRLADEYASVRTQYRTHRRRAIPKLGFDATAYSPEEVAKLAGATVNEMVALKPSRPDVNLAQAIVPIQYNAIDPALYDTSRVMQEMEKVWGVQEALSQSISTAKTATEAQIQQTGFYARSGSQRDSIDDALSELATYTAELAIHHMSLEDVQQIAGPDAFWPEGLPATDLQQLVAVHIRAGSSGKPNTAQEREQWTALYPIISNGIREIGQMRGSDPAEIADRVEELLREVVSKMGDGIDVERFVPQTSGAGQPQLPPGGEGGGPAMEPQSNPEAAAVPPTDDPMGM